MNYKVWFLTACDRAFAKFVSSAAASLVFGVRAFMSSLFYPGGMLLFSPADPTFAIVFLLLTLCSYSYKYALLLRIEFLYALTTTLNAKC